VLGFPYAVAEEARNSGSPVVAAIDDASYSWGNRSEYRNEHVRTVYPGWGLEFGKKYVLQNAVIKAVDVVVKCLPVSRKHFEDEANAGLE
jgi:hypothetical protein